METINAVGRRKASIARVFLKKGSGKIVINGKDLNDYFTVAHIRDRVIEPLQATDTVKDYDFKVNVNGGGIKGQAEAVMLGIARSLVKENEEYKPLLKAQDLMTRDSRVVERKKPGLRKARKSDQFSKR
jgi:small subunit ribosomal protein S9